MSHDKSARPKFAADWEHWADIPQADLWEAVALSMDIEPKLLPGTDWRPISGDIFDRCPEPFPRRLEKAQRCAIARTLPARTAGSHVRVWTVMLADFRAWAESLQTPWVLPEQFSRNGSVGKPISTVEPIKPEIPSESEAATSTAVVPVQRQAAQEAALLAKLAEMNLDAKALPAHQTGQPGVKAAVKRELGTEGLWAGATVFTKAWERLLDDGRIAYRNGVDAELG